MSKKLSSREAARLEAQRIAAKQSAGDNRTRNLLIGAIGLVILALIGVGYLLVKESQKTILTDFEGPTPAVSTLRGGIPFGGPDAMPGVVNEGVMEIDIYADFHCPACASFDSVQADDIRELITSGDAAITYHPVNILDRSGNSSGYATRAANAFLEVVEHEPEKALDFMEALFAYQPSDRAGYTDEQLGEVAETIGVGEATIEKFANGTFIPWVDAARKQANRDGMRSTPSIAFNGKIEEFDWTVPGSLIQRANG